MLSLQKINLDKDRKMEDKLDGLKNRLKEYKSAVIAFSGGVDSTFLARVAKDVYGDNLLLITATSSTYPFYELEYLLFSKCAFVDAVPWCKAMPPPNPSPRSPPPFLGLK